MEKLIALKTTGNTVFNDVGTSSSLKLKGDIQLTSTNGDFKVNGGYLDMDMFVNSKELQSFTIEAMVSPNSINGNKQMLLESDNLQVSIYIDESGFLTADIETTAEKSQLKSTQKLVAGSPQMVRLYRDESGETYLETDNQVVARKKITGEFKDASSSVFRVGASLKSEDSTFKGTIGQINVSAGVSTLASIQQDFKYSRELEKTLSEALKGIVIHVNYESYEARKKLQRVKQIMNAAGVESLSSLGTMKFTSNRTIQKGNIWIQPGFVYKPIEHWATLGVDLIKADMATKRRLMATELTNKNSINYIKILKEGPLDQRKAGFGKVKKLSKKLANGQVKGAKESLNMFTKKDGQLFVYDKKLFTENLKGNKPQNWQQLGTLDYHFNTLNIISQNEAIIIAKKLDLTNCRLEVSADVDKLIILAEEVICGPNAEISWRRPGGYTQGHADDPYLDGIPNHNTAQREFNQDQRSGYAGGYGGKGAAGIVGANGRKAPSLEMWVKNMTNLPNIDLNGEDGITGGIGQRGGRGGNGQGGSVGTYWPIINECKKNAGNGGRGGNGGNGGDGGRGGDGGNGGNISIGVLQGTLEGTVTNNSFRWKNQGGQPGQGGAGALGGDGGLGGRSGNDKDYCHNARNGDVGANGQRGYDGQAGYNHGLDGVNEFFQFSLDAWNEQLTRPFITSVSTYEAFPGDTIVVKGTTFANSDKVIFDGSIELQHHVNADGSMNVVLPLDTSGGSKALFILRVADNFESNRVNIRIKPQLDVFADQMMPGVSTILRGRAFVPGASVLINNQSIAAEVAASGKELTFTMLGFLNQGNSSVVSVQVRNPDGMLSNERSVSQAGVLEIPYRFGKNNLSFHNPNIGKPSFDTFKKTFGSSEVWHESFDPIFGHPMLTAAFFVFYTYFLKGKGDGGLATGFCTAMSAKVADNLWTNNVDITGIQEADIIEELTAIHGKLLSKESLIHFHDWGRTFADNVDYAIRSIETTFLRGCDRNNTPLLFFIPAGEVWDSGYFDKLSDSHCLYPYRFVYPAGHTGPKLSADALSTVNSLDGVKLYCYDCNNETNPDCFLEFSTVDGKLTYTYNKKPEFRLDKQITIGIMSNGAFTLADHDMPFNGPFGVLGFAMDFMLSPADIEITDELGLKAGHINGKIYSEIPGSHPCYLVPGTYLLPTGKNLTRKIRGTASGTYTFNSIMPNGAMIKLENIKTNIGEVDTILVTADNSQMRLTTQQNKDIALTISRIVDEEIRALTIKGLSLVANLDMDITISPDLSVCRIGNHQAVNHVSVIASVAREKDNIKSTNTQSIPLQVNSDLLVAFNDWKTTDFQLNMVPF